MVAWARPLSAEGGSERQRAGIDEKYVFTPAARLLLLCAGWSTERSHRSGIARFPRRGRAPYLRRRVSSSPPPTRPPLPRFASRFSSSAMPDPSGPQFLAVEQIAEEFQLTSQTIRNWIKGGALPAVRVGHVFRVKREDLDAMIARQSSETSELGSHRDPWTPETLGLPHKRRAGERPPSVWDGMSAPIANPQRS